MAEDVLQLQVTVNFDDTAFKNGLDNVKEKAKTVATSVSSTFESIGTALNSVGTTLSGWGTTLTTAITAPVVALGVYTGKTAVEFLKLKENTKTAFEVLLGSGEQAEQMLKDIYDFAQGSPLSYQSYLETSKQLVAMGVAANDVIPYLDKMTNAAIATGKGEQGLNTLAEAIGRMSTRGKVSLEELNRLTEMGVPAVQILGNAYGYTSAQMFEAMKKGEILTQSFDNLSESERQSYEQAGFVGNGLEILLEGMNNGTQGVNGATAAYGGLAAKMEGTLTGAIDTVKARFRDMSTVLFDSENAYPVLTEMLNNFAEALKVIPTLLKKFTEAVAPALNFVNEKIKAFTEFVKNADSSQLERISQIILGLVTIGPVLLIVGKLLIFLGQLSKAIGILAGAFEWLGPAIASVTSIGFLPLIGIITAVIGVFIFLRDEWNKVVAVFTGFLEKTGILNTFQSIWDKVQLLWSKLSALHDIFYVIGAVVSAVLLPAVAVLMGTFNGLAKALDGIMTVVNGVVDVLSGLGEIIVGIFTGNTDKIFAGLNTLWDGIKEIFIGALSAIWGYLSGYVEGFFGFFASIFDAIGLTDWLNNTWTSVSTWLNNVWTSITEWGTNIWNSITGWFTSTSDSINSWWADLWNGITGFFTLAGQLIWVGIQLIANIIIAAFTIITLPFMFIWENCKQYVFDAFNAISAFLSSIWNSILAFLMPILQSIADFFVTIWNAISTTVTTVATNIWNSIVSIFTSIWNSIVSIFTSIWNFIVSIATSIWNSVVSVFTNIWNSIVSIFTSIWNFIVSIFNSIKNSVTSVWNSISIIITGIANNIWNSVVSVFNRVKNSVTGVWNSIKSATESVWNGIKNAISSPIEGAYNTVTGWINKLKSAFSGFMVHIKLPHFSIKNASWNPMDWIANGVPYLNVDWYAKGAVLKEPTAFGINPSNNSIMAGGEAGDEAVAPISTLQNYIKQAVNESNSGNNGALSTILNALYNLLEKYLPLYTERNIIMDGAAVAKVITPYVDTELGTTNSMKERGNR